VIKKPRRSGVMKSPQKGGSYLRGRGQRKFLETSLGTGNHYITAGQKEKKTRELVSMGPNIRFKFSEISKCQLILGGDQKK